MFKQSFSLCVSNDLKQPVELIENMHILNDISLTLIPVHLLREPRVGPVAIASAAGSTFPPPGSDTLLQFFAHNLFDQDLDSAHGKATQMLTKLLLVWHDGCG